MFRLLLCSLIARSFFNTQHPLFFSRLKNNIHCKWVQMGAGSVNPEYSKIAKFRMCNVSGYMTELLEIQAPNPTMHVLFIPGNPGIVTFYNDFVESLYEELGGKASITAIGHISHTSKDWEHGRLFSLEDQINHKIDYIAHELQNNSAPIILVGHSIGSHIASEMFKRASQVIYFIGLYPFLALNSKSSKQTVIRKLAESSIVCSLVSSIVALLGVVPSLSRFIVKTTLGNSWSAAAIDAACSHLLKYHTMQNMLFMAKTEFEKFSEAPDWDFLKAKPNQIAFLFGIDDHWGPLSLFEEISKQVPDVSLSIEKEGHDHAFSCTEAGSTWVAQHVAGLLKKHL
ncbi:lipid droplet-associated hydrolase-like isoform X1 [Chenopodium quinoa]|uniref:lipid droplet-associated hydrolase-like isoform X1 n=2 Tax=Chenopodium quinoa TaxID=63459 RepID=UPI000B76F0D7|nr:lipid droplet-associated hydrolase-like isoform X1 [Chenopodium quinoa]